MPPRVSWFAYVAVPGAVVVAGAAACDAGASARAPSAATAH